MVCDPKHTMGPEGWHPVTLKCHLHASQGCTSCTSVKTEAARWCGVIRPDDPIATALGSLAARRFPGSPHCSVGTFHCGQNTRYSTGRGCRLWPVTRESKSPPGASVSVRTNCWSCQDTRSVQWSPSAFRVSARNAVLSRAQDWLLVLVGRTRGSRSGEPLARVAVPLDSCTVPISARQMLHRVPTVAASVEPVTEAGCHQLAGPSVQLAAASTMTFSAMTKGG